MEATPEDKGASKTPEKPVSSKTGSKIRRSTKTPRRPSKTSTKLSQKERSSIPSLPPTPSSPKHQDEATNQTAFQAVPSKEPTQPLADVPGSQEKLPECQPAVDQPDAIPSTQRPLSKDRGGETPNTRRSTKASRKPSKCPSQKSERGKRSTPQSRPQPSSPKLQDGDVNQLSLEVAHTDVAAPTSPGIPGSTGRHDKDPEYVLAASQADAIGSSHTLLSVTHDQETEATKPPPRKESTTLLSTSCDNLASGVSSGPGIEGKTSDSSLAQSVPVPVQRNQDHPPSVIPAMETKEAPDFNRALAPVVLPGGSLESGLRIMAIQDNVLGEALPNERQCPGGQRTEDTDIPVSCQMQTLVMPHASITAAETSCNILEISQKDSGRTIDTSLKKEGRIIGSSQTNPGRIIGTSQKEPERVIGQYKTKVHILRNVTSDLESAKSERPTEATTRDRNLGTTQSEVKTPTVATPSQVMRRCLGKIHLWAAATSPSAPHMVSAAVVFVLLAFAVVLAFFLSHGRHQKIRYDICSTQACEAYSKRLLNSMNVSVNPCESFTHYVCDGWSRGNELSVNEDTMQAALDRLYRFVIDLKVADSAQTPFERAAIFYRSCLCVGRGKCDQLPEVSSALLESGIVWPRPAPSPDVLRTLLFSSLRLRWGGLFSIKMTSHPREKHLFLHIANELFLLKQKMDEHLSVSEALRERYFQVLKDQFGNATNLNSKDENFVSFEETLDLDVNVFDNLFESVQKQPWATIEDYLADGTVANLTEQRWRDALRDCGVQIKPEDTLVFSSNAVTFVRHFLFTWAQTPDELMHLLVSWCTVQVAALFTNQELLVNFHGNQGKAELRHGIFCFSRTFLITGRDVLYGYSSYFLPQVLLPMAEELVLEVRQAFRRRVLGWEHYDKNVTVVHDWNSTKVTMKYFYDPGTRDSNDQTGLTQQTQTVEKLPNNEGFKGDSLVANWRMAADGLLGDAVSFGLSIAIENRDQYLLVNGEESKDMTLLPYAFTFPYFDREATRAFNYAGVGTIVAEALGRLFLDASFPSISAQRDLNSFVYCMENSMPNKLNRRSYGRHVEPISLRTSLDAYRANSEALLLDRRVKGLEFLSTEQLFFVAACFTRCTGRQDSWSVAPVQCDDTFKHVPEFATVFECKPGAPMNPKERCKLL